MQLFKNMEVLLMLVFGVVCAVVLFAPAQATRAAGPVRTIATATATTAAAPAAPATPTVHVIGHRLAQATTPAVTVPTLQDGESSIDED